MRGEQALFNLKIKKKSGLDINPDIHHSKVFSSSYQWIKFILILHFHPYNICFYIMSKYFTINQPPHSHWKCPNWKKKLTWTDVEVESPLARREVWDSETLVKLFIFSRIYRTYQGGRFYTGKISRKINTWKK